MKIRKILVVPAEHRLLKSTEKSLDSKMSFFNKVSLFFKKQPKKYNAEINFYGDLPLILGEKNVYVFGEYQNHYLESAHAFDITSGQHRAVLQSI